MEVIRKVIKYTVERDLVPVKIAQIATDFEELGFKITSIKNEQIKGEEFLNRITVEWETENDK